MLLAHQEGKNSQAVLGQHIWKNITHMHNFYIHTVWGPLIGPQGDGASVKQLSSCGLPVVLGPFSIKFGGKDVCIKLLVVVFQLISMHKHLCKRMIWSNFRVKGLKGARKKASHPL